MWKYLKQWAKSIRTPKNPCAVKKRLDHKIRIRLVVFIACIASATSTYTVLKLAANAGKKAAAMKNVASDYVRFTAMGYDEDTVSKKRNLLVSITDGGELCRLHLFTFDEDRHTLDILELPPRTAIQADGFTGTFSEAFDLPIFKEIVGRVLMLSIDNSISMDVEAVSHTTAVLGGAELTIDKELTVGDTVLPKGKRTIAGSTAGVISSYKEAYVINDINGINAYRRLLASIISRLDEKGALDWFSSLMGVIVNETESDMAVTELIEYVNLSNNISLESVNIRLLPGTGTGDSYASDTAGAADMLNSFFRVKGKSFDKEKLGLTDTVGAENSYSDLKTKINEILK